MPERSAVAALGSLLADPGALSLYERNPAEAADVLSVKPSERAVFESWDVAALRRQARGLVDKRWHEARRYLPLTAASLGARGAERFREFAGAFWPSGHRRHLADARAFSRWLRVRRDPAWSAEEDARLAVANHHWPIALRWSRSFLGRRGKRRALLLALRVRGAIRILALYRA